jgi:hypothetical protein
MLGRRQIPSQLSGQEGRPNSTGSRTSDSAAFSLDSVSLAQRPGTPGKARATHPSV